MNFGATGCFPICHEGAMGERVLGSPKFGLCTHRSNNEATRDFFSGPRFEMEGLGEPEEMAWSQRQWVFMVVHHDHHDHHDHHGCGNGDFLSCLVLGDDLVNPLSWGGPLHATPQPCIWRWISWTLLWPGSSNQNSKMLEVRFKSERKHFSVN